MFGLRFGRGIKSESGPASTLPEHACSVWHKAVPGARSDLVPSLCSNDQLQWNSPCHILCRLAAVPCMPTPMPRFESRRSSGWHWWLGWLAAGEQQAGDGTAKFQEQTSGHDPARPALTAAASNKLWASALTVSLTMILVAMARDKPQARAKAVIHSSGVRLFLDAPDKPFKHQQRPSASQQGPAWHEHGG